MDSRILIIQECAEFLAEPHGGDREAMCLTRSVRAALELCVDILAGCGVACAKGYRDAIDKMVAHRVLDADLGDRLARVCDVAERLPAAWSSVSHDEFEWARETASRTLAEFLDVAERRLAHGAQPRPAHP